MLKNGVLLQYFPGEKHWKNPRAHSKRHLKKIMFLAVNARPKPKPPPPAPAPAPPPPAYQQPAAPAPAPTGARPTAPEDMAEGVRDPGLAQMLQKDAAVIDSLRTLKDKALTEEASRFAEGKAPRYCWGPGLHSSKSASNIVVDRRADVSSPGGSHCVSGGRHGRAARDDELPVGRATNSRAHRGRTPRPGPRRVA